MPPEGRVLLVGAGPGAADLLTIRALRAIQAADIVLHDALVSDEVLALIPAGVPRAAVGKRAHRPSTAQDFINRLMARRALKGNVVVRLKGGDPSIFGRAAEERAYLEARGVRVEVIAGVTTASAAAAQFAFSLTTRGGARGVLFATGRTLSGPQMDWSAAADAETTLCIYMGYGEIGAIAERLLARGRAPDTPALAMTDIERPGAALISSTLARLADDLGERAAGAPTLIAIGSACASAFDVARKISAGGGLRRAVHDRRRPPDQRSSRA